MFDRRVHVTTATLLQLNGKFDVEPGNGGNREGYLADHKVETYLIIPPKVSQIFFREIFQLFEPNGV